MKTGEAPQAAVPDEVDWKNCRVAIPSPRGTGVALVSSNAAIMGAAAMRKELRSMTG